LYPLDCADVLGSAESCFSQYLSVYYGFLNSLFVLYAFTYFGILDCLLIYIYWFTVEDKEDCSFQATNNSNSMFLVDLLSVSVVP